MLIVNLFNNVFIILFENLLELLMLFYIHYATGPKLYHGYMRFKLDLQVQLCSSFFASTVWHD